MISMRLRLPQIVQSSVRTRALSPYRPTLSQPSLRCAISMSSSDSDEPKPPLPAQFSSDLESQVSHLEKYGYVLIKGTGSETDRTKISELHTQTLDFFESKRSTWRYRWWRFWHKVSTAKNRHSIPLNASEHLVDVLNTTIGRSRPLLEHFIPAESPCVEISSVISFPGSQRQVTHSDISFSAHSLVITGFMALSDVTFKAGPTFLHPGTHTSAFHRRCTNVYSQRRVPTYDGWEDSVSDLEAFSIFPPTETTEATQAAEDAVEAAPVYALLEAGDLLLFNTQIFHYGGPNEGEHPRALLSFSFQRPDEDGKARKIEGFTYHLDRSARGKFLLSTFEA